MESFGPNVVLSPSMYQQEKKENFLDTLAMVTQLGPPDFLLSMHCNEEWKEIADALRPGQTSANRPDILVQVFHEKYKSLLNDIQYNNCLGGSHETSYFSEVEFVTDNGNPTAHIFVIMDKNSRIDKPDTIDSIDSQVCAEIPDEKINPRLHALVSRWMVHGPCGNKEDTCMNSSLACKNGFPKKFVETTAIIEGNVPLYRRRKNCFRLQKNGKSIDNSWIIPYNPNLLLKYETRIDINVCTFVLPFAYIKNFVDAGTGHVRSFLLPPN